MTKEEYRRKVEGCWVGKNIGGTLGMPMEWNRSSNDVTYYTHEITGEPLPNDDLDIQILWMLAMEDCGTAIDEKVLGEYFNEFMVFTHAEYGTAKVNLRAGLQPPVSGSFNNDFKDSCGSFIRSEIWACLYPGNPGLAASYAFKDAIVDHGDGEGVYAEIFIAAMESTAFYEHDIRLLLKIGLSYIPNDCAVARGVRKALETFDAGITEHDSRDLIMKEYIGHLEWHYISPEDEKKGYNEGKMGWDVPSNIMIITYALLFGDSDFEKSVCTAVHYGEDTDCTAGTIAALFGIIYGTDFFPEKWLKPVGRKITTCSINPFLMMNRIPATIDEMTDRVISLHEQAGKQCAGSDPCKSFMAPSWFCNIYREMHTVKYEFPYLNVRLDYCGDPVINRSERKKIRLIISNTAKTISSERVNIYLYTKDDCKVYPSPEMTVFLTMAHMGSGIKSVEFEIERTEVEKSRYEFVVELRFENSQFSSVMDVPFVLLSETGTTVPVIWEKRGSPRTPNLPRV